MWSGGWAYLVLHSVISSNACLLASYDDRWSVAAVLWESVLDRLVHIRLDARLRLVLLRGVARKDPVCFSEASADSLRNVDDMILASETK